MITKTFGLACLLWAIVLTIAAVKEKGKCFIEGKKHIGYITIGILYVLALLL